LRFSTEIAVCLSEMILDRPIVRPTIDHEQEAVMAMAADRPVGPDDPE